MTRCSKKWQDETEDVVRNGKMRQDVVRNGKMRQDVVRNGKM